MRHLISSPSRLLGAQRQRSVLRRKLVGALAGEEADAFLRAADVCAAAEQVPARSALCRLEHSTMVQHALAARAPSRRFYVFARQCFCSEATAGLTNTSRLACRCCARYVRCPAAATGGEVTRGDESRS
jgi:hypothetical protein